MPREFRFAVAGTELKAIGWASVQNDNSFSIGLSDRLFKVKGFHVAGPGGIGTPTTDLEAAFGPKAVTNPHFTFHPAIYFHLHANEQPELFAGNMEVPLMLAQQECVPWVSLTSNPIEQLQPLRPARPGSSPDVIRLPTPRSAVSVQLVATFVSPIAIPRTYEAAFNRYVAWSKYCLHLSWRFVPAQKSTAEWIHHS